MIDFIDLAKMLTAGLLVMLAVFVGIPVFVFLVVKLGTFAYYQAKQQIERKDKNDSQRPS